MTARELSTDDQDDRSRAIGYTVAQAAQLLGISETSVRKRISRGALPAWFDGKRWTVFLPAIVAVPSSAEAAGQPTAAGTGVFDELLEPIVVRPASRLKVHSSLPAPSPPSTALARLSASSAPAASSRRRSLRVVLALVVALASAVASGYGLSRIAAGWFNASDGVAARPALAVVAAPTFLSIAAVSS